MEQQSFLSELEFTPVQASQGKRFANYIIDVFVFYILVFIFGMVMGVVSPGFFSYGNNDDIGSRLMGRLISLFIYGLYMFVMEAIFKGRSVGKFITGTKAVNEDGSDISFQTALLRGLSRAVPFEAFSAFGDPSYPWHDKWTQTYVIDLKASHVN